MWGGSALADALDLARSPALSTHLRQRPLPSDVLTVIRIASDCPDTMRDAERSTGRDRDFLMAAAAFYIQKILCFQGADPYRTLGVQPDATRDHMRLHMRHLMKSLHPDRSRSEWRAASAARVMSAWREVNAAPDRARPAERPSAIARRRVQAPTYKPPWVPRPLVKPKRSPASARPRRGALRMVGLLAALLRVPTEITASFRRRFQKVKGGAVEAVISVGALSPNVLVSEDTMAPVQTVASVPEAAPAPALARDDGLSPEGRDGP